MRETPPGPYPSHHDPIAHLLGRVAWLMDRAFPLPGTRVRVGLDAIFGLLPIGGDILTGVVQAGLVLIALGRYRVPPAVAARMLANVLVDVGVGSIPLLGDLFDVAFKANTRNMALLDPYLHPGRTGPSPSPKGGPPLSVIDVTPAVTSWGCLLAVAVTLLAALSLVVIGFFTVIRWLVQAG